MTTKYPNITVHLTKVDGNAFAILGAVISELRAAGLSKETITEFRKEAMSGDYDHLLQTVIQWVEVE